VKSTKNRGGKTSTSGKAATPVGGKKKFTVDESKLGKITGGAASNGKRPDGRITVN